MNKRFYIFIFLLSVLISCKDDNTTNVIPVKPNSVFEFKEGDTFLLENNKGELCSLIVRSTQLKKWALSFWDTATKIELNSIVFEKKTYNGSIAIYEEFALAKTDSGYLFGTANNPLIDKNYPLEYISYQFFIPNTVSQSKTESVNKNLKIGDLDYTVSFTATINPINKISFPVDTLRNAFSIKYVAQRTVYMPVNTGSDYTICEGVGFYRFWDYYLIKKL